MKDIPFTFSDAEQAPSGTRVAAVPAALTKKSELLASLYDALRLPEYFGSNWDSLSDCLRDLHWVEERDVVVTHTDVPQLNAGDLRIYLEILAEAVASWGPGDDHCLYVNFPHGAEAEIAAALGS